MPFLHQLDQFKLTDFPPVKQGDIFQVGESYFQDIGVEPLYYEFRNLVNNIEVGFSNAKYSVPDLNPPLEKIYYITNIGINGALKSQVYYQANSPRNTVGAKTSQRLDDLQANYLDPFAFHFAIISGDTCLVDINTKIINGTPLQNVKGAIWFYGWKLKKADIKTPDSGTNIIVLEDVRE